MLERGWIGGGNTGRNTTIVRSNYLYPESARLYDFSLRLYEGSSRELNFNIMLSQRGLIVLAHSRHDLDAMARWANAMRMNGVDVEMLSRGRVAALAPLAGHVSPHGALPRTRRLLPARARARARHDAVAWGYARAAEALGVDIIQNCEVQEFIQEARPRERREDHARHASRAERIGIAAAGHSSVLAKLAGFRLPVTSYALQAMVSEPVKPMLGHRDAVPRYRRLRQPVRQRRDGDRRRCSICFPLTHSAAAFAVKQIDPGGDAGALPVVQPLAL